MANLKLDQELLLHQLGREGDRAIAGIRGAVERAREEVREVAAMIPALAGTSATDLMTTAAIAFGKEVETAYDSSRGQLRIELNGSAAGFSFYQNCEEAIPAGKYRALFFLMPVKP